jgi:hypothetical protein
MENSSTQAPEAPPLYCGKTVEDIRAMRMRHGHLFVAEVVDGDQTFHAICREPTLQVISVAQAIGKTDEAKGAMALYDNCVVEADGEIKSRDMLKLRVAEAVGTKVSSLSSSVKNV